MMGKVKKKKPPIILNPTNRPIDFYVTASTECSVG
jgi:hypothetical protein